MLLPVISIVLFGLAAVALLYIGIVYCRRLYLIRSVKRECDFELPVDDDKLPSASIIIYTRSEPEALLRNLPKMMAQDYPKPFEVIVVNEGASAETSMAVGHIKIAYPNIYLTYTPDGARNLSRKKLALTLGIKAAKGDVVVISDATSEITSDKWLRRLLQPFANSQTEVVLGYGAPKFVAGKFASGLTRAFDVVADNVAWLAAAVTKHPYRGCGYNLAYRRQLFFDNKGFSRSLNLRDGDDDIFVNEITNGANTCVQLSEEAIASKEIYNYKRQTTDYRTSHAFTGRRLPMTSRRLMALGEWLMCGVIVLSVAGAWFAGTQNMLGWIIATVLVCGMLALTGFSWHLTLKALRAPSPRAWLPFIIITRPLRNIKMAMRSRMAKNGFYTWQ